ncbi:MAG: mechanosensitive ion channel [Pseudomonadales bacterium]
MDKASEFSQQSEEALTSSINEIIQHLPNIAGALILLILGWLVARFVQVATVKLLNYLNRFLDRVLTGRPRAIIRFSSGITRFVAAVFFWITLFLFLTAAMRVAGLLGVAAWLEQIVTFLPAIIFGGVIILSGYLLSCLVRELAVSAAQSASLSEVELIGKIAQAITFVTALIIGLKQLGIDVSFITIMLGIASASLLLGFAIAFGLGSKTFVSNLIAAYYIRDLIEPGQKVRIGQQEGTVLEVSSTTIVLDTPEGRTSIPTKYYQEEPITVLLDDTNYE